MRKMYLIPPPNHSSETHRHFTNTQHNPDTETDHFNLTNFNPHTHGLQLPSTQHYHKRDQIHVAQGLNIATTTKLKTSFNKI